MDAQFTAVYLDFAAGLDKVSGNGQFVSIKIKRTSCQVEVSLYYLIFLKRPTGFFAVGKSYVTAILIKLNNGCRRCEYNAIFREVLYIYNIKLRISAVKRNSLQTLSAENYLVSTGSIEIIAVAIKLLSEIALELQCSCC